MERNEAIARMMGMKPASLTCGRAEGDCGDDGCGGCEHIVIKWPDFALPENAARLLTWLWAFDGVFELDSQTNSCEIWPNVGGSVYGTGDTWELALADAAAQLAAHLAAKGGKN